MKITSRVASLSALVLAGTGLMGLAASAANAQGALPSTSADTPRDPLPDSTSAAPAAAVDEVKINQFADAYVAVQTIQKNAAAQPTTTQDPQATQTLMVNAIKKSGLQVDEFNQIAQLMNTDLELRNKIAGKVQERDGS